MAEGRDCDFPTAHEDLEDYLSGLPAIDETDPNPSRRPLNLNIPNQGGQEYKLYEEVMKLMCKYKTIANIPYHIISTVEDSLNVKKYDRNDWRQIASILEMKRPIIEKIEKDNLENPCKVLFEQLSNKTVESLLQALWQTKRHDVLNIIHEKLPAQSMLKASTAPEKREGFKKVGKHPSQESTPNSTNSEKYQSFSPLNSPYKGPTGTPKSADSDKSSLDSGIQSPQDNRSRSGSIPITHSDGKTTEDQEHFTKVDFHSEESRQAWKEIPPGKMSTTKEWKHFEEFLQKKFRRESHMSNLMRFICYVLQVGKYEHRTNKYIKDQDFANMVAWFGPFKSGKEGCLEKMIKLMRGSVGHVPEGSEHSFFGGYMTKDEADEAISGGNDGTFLIRFSSTNAQRGSFVVVLKTPYGPEHHEITQDEPPTGKVNFDGKTYNDLTELFKKRLCREGVSCDRRTLCTITCRGLPLNAMFKSYQTGPVPQHSMGRGRGRGRSPQE